MPPRPVMPPCWRITAGKHAAPNSPPWPRAGAGPRCLHDVQRQSWNDAETVLSPATAPAYQLQWKVAPGGSLVASPAVVGDTIYQGSWDGKEYALDVRDGSTRWKTDLGTMSLHT